MDTHTRREIPADDCPRIGDAPRQSGRRPPVTVTGKVAADAADSVTERNRRSARIHHLNPGQAVTPDIPSHRPEPTDEPAIPGESSAGEETRPGVGKNRVPLLEQKEQPGTEQAADRSPQHECRG